MKRLILLALAITMTACATAHHGPMQRIYVDTNPVGAHVELAHCGALASATATTPATVWVSRRSTQCTLELTKLGYKPLKVKLARHVASEMADNATMIEIALDGVPHASDEVAAAMFVGALGAATGLAVDAASGAMFVQTPTHVVARLCPTDDIDCDSRDRSENARLTH